MDLPPSMLSSGAMKRLRVHRIIARMIRRNPGLRREALNRLAKMRDLCPGNPAHDSWEALLTGHLSDLFRVLTAETEEAAALRKESPRGFIAPKALRAQIWTPGRTRELRL